MELWDFIQITAVLGFFTGIGFWRWRVSMRNARVIEDVATSKVRSAAQGYVELCGRQIPCRGDSPLRSPLSSRSCTWWSYTIEKKKRTGKKTKWVTIEDKTSPHLFMIEDDTGDAMVNPAGAEVVTRTRERWYGRTARPTGGPESGSFILFANYRYTETVMRPGEPLYAIGHFETRTGVPDPGERGRQAVELLREWKADPEALAERFDADGDGKVDAFEFERAREEAQRVVEEQATAVAAESEELHLLLQPRDGRAFLLSSKPQEELVKHYKRATVGWLLVWIVCGAALGVMLSARFAGG